MAIITIENVKKFLNIPNDKQDHDFVIQALIDGTTQLAKEQLWRRDIESTSYDIYRDGDGTNYIWGLQYPISTITTFTIEDVSQTVTTDYELYDTQGYIYTYTKTPVGNKNIHLVYTAGYAEGSIKASQKMALYELIKFYYDRRDSIAVTSRSDGALQTNYDTSEIPASILKMFSADKHKTFQPA